MICQLGNKCNMCCVAIELSYLYKLPLCIITYRSHESKYAWDVIQQQLCGLKTSYGLYIWKVEDVHNDHKHNRNLSIRTFLSPWTQTSNTVWENLSGTVIVWYTSVTWHPSHISLVWTFNCWCNGGFIPISRQRTSRSWLIDRGWPLRPNAEFGAEFLINYIIKHRLNTL